MLLEEERYTFAEVAKKTNVSISTVWRWSMRGVKGRKLSSILLGGRRYVLRSQLEAFCGSPRRSSSSTVRQKIASQKLDALVGTIKENNSSDTKTKGGNHELNQASTTRSPHWGASKAALNKNKF